MSIQIGKSGEQRNVNVGERNVNYIKVLWGFLGRHYVEVYLGLIIVLDLNRLASIRSQYN